MATTTKSKPAEATIAPEFIIPDLSEMMEGFNLQGTIIKLAIGYAFAITGWIASWEIAVTFALMTSGAWLQYVIVFAVLALCLVAVVYATPHVVNGVYNAGAWIGSKAKSLFASSKEKFSSIEMPSFATKH